MAIDFDKLNIGKYKSIYIKPIRKITGNLSLLELSFDTLKKLTVNLITVGDLKMFSVLEKLNITCGEIDLSLLPETLKHLTISSDIIKNIGEIQKYKNITEFHVSCDHDIIFPPNVKYCYIYSKV